MHFTSQMMAQQRGDLVQDRQDFININTSQRHKIDAGIARSGLTETSDMVIDTWSSSGICVSCLAK